MSNTQAAIITIGDELLIGQTIDTNSAQIAQLLNALGIDVIRRVAVGDDKAAIINALNEEQKQASLILITGGLGPTADDITKPLLCEYFGAKMVVNETVLSHLKEIFTKRNRPFLERNLKQAEVPDNCTVLYNKFGTAPGMWFEKNDKIFIAMPGVPFEMASIMEDEVIPRLGKNNLSDTLLHYSIITAGEGESFIAEKIKDIEEALPVHIKLAYLPGAGMVKLRLTGRGKDKTQLADELQKFQQQIVSILTDIVVALEDVPMEKIIGDELLKHNATLGLAESCTGGNIANHITNVPGCSQYFKGNIVCYQTEIKEKLLHVEPETLEKYSAVSEEVAIEMAHGARAALGSDYALSVTGVLGPDKDERGSEVGTVWMAVCNGEETKTKKFYFPYDRARNKEMATQMGMLMIWRFLNNKL